MKIFRTILAAIACFLIAVGVFSVVGYELYFRHAAPELPAQATVQDQTEPTVPDEPTPEPEPEPLPPELSQEELRAQELLSNMTLEQKIYQMFFTTPEALTGVEAATRAGDATKEALLTNPVGGLIYSEKNLEDEQQVKALLEGTQKFLTEGERFPAFLAIDEEGGDVAPVADTLKTTSFDTMAELGLTKDPAAALAMGETIAKEIGKLGFNVNFAPLADLADEDHNDLIGSRSFGTDAELTASMVSSVIQGSQSNGVLNAVAHFPGLGSIDDVAHVERTRMDRSLDELLQEELIPFKAAIDDGVGFIVVSHSILPSLDDQRPCSMSPSVMELLRDTLGFRGIILTDTMDIPAITDYYETSDAVINAITAGADMIQCPDDLDKAVEALIKAVEDGKIPQSRIDESITRILAAKIKLGLVS